MGVDARMEEAREVDAVVAQAKRRLGEREGDCEDAHHHGAENRVPRVVVAARDYRRVPEAPYGAVDQGRAPAAQREKPHQEIARPAEFLTESEEAGDEDTEVSD